MSTDTDLRDQAVAKLDAMWAELRATETGYKKLKVKPPTMASAPRWYQALQDDKAARALLAQIGAAPDPDPDPDPAGPWLGWTVPGLPAAGVTVVTSGSQLAALLRAPAPSGRYDARALTATLVNQLIDGACPLGQHAMFWLGPNVRFTGTVRSEPAVTVWGAQNLRLYGGRVENPVGHGIVSRSKTGGAVQRNAHWWDFTIDNCGATAFLCHQGSGPVEGADYRGTCRRWSRDLGLDPHRAPGTGNHGGYISASDGAGRTVQGTFVLDVADSEYGNGVQTGPLIVDSIVQIKAKNLTGDPNAMDIGQGVDGTAGNAYAPFGGGQKNLVVSHITADNCRKTVEPSVGTPVNPIRVTYGRTTNQWKPGPSYGDAGGDIVYTDCS